MTEMKPNYSYAARIRMDMLKVEVLEALTELSHNRDVSNLLKKMFNYIGTLESAICNAFETNEKLTWNNDVLMSRCEICLANYKQE